MSSNPPNPPFIKTHGDSTFDELMGDMAKAGQTTTALQKATAALQDARESHAIAAARQTLLNSTLGAGHTTSQRNAPVVDRAKQKIDHKQAAWKKANDACQASNGPAGIEKRSQLYSAAQRKIAEQNAGKNPTEMKPKGPSGGQGSRGQ